MVNGIMMTGLTPITKFMAHLPLAYHEGTAKIRAGHLLRHGDEFPFCHELGY